MSGPHLTEVRRASIRVALMAAGVVAVAYLVVAVAVVLVVTGNLTGQIDGRLLDQLNHHGVPPGGGPGDRPYDAPTLSWRVDPDGSVSYIGPSTYAFELPAAFTSITQPQTVTLKDTQFRIAGAAIADDYFIVAQSMTNVSDTQNTLIVAEAVIGPLLVLIVFLGAVAIGRRVAAPIELARQRQLEFTADASHELRTPLSVIEAHTSLALAQDRPPEWYRRAFERVETESRRMRRLLDDMLWLARFDASRTSPNAEPVDLATLARQTADRFAIVAEARHLRLDVRAGTGALVVTAPPEWLDRLLGVLLDNACRYSPEGGLVRVAVVPDGNRVRLTVEDSGPGIAEEEWPRIFDRFHRASDAPGGAGLGLAIGDAIVRATNGRWRVGRSDAGGASMSISWPRAFAGQREADPGEAEAGPSSASAQHEMASPPAPR